MHTLLNRHGFMAQKKKKHLGKGETSTNHPVFEFHVSFRRCIPGNNFCCPKTLQKKPPGIHVARPASVMIFSTKIFSKNTSWKNPEKGSKVPKKVIIHEDIMKLRDSSSYDKGFIILIQLRLGSGSLWRKTWLVTEVYGILNAYLKLHIASELEVIYHLSIQPTLRYHPSSSSI